MRYGTRINWLAGFSGLSLLGALLLTVSQLVGYSQSFAAMPAGLSLAGVPVAGLNEQQALQQLVLVYNSPIELQYQDQLILLEPSVVNFQIDTAVMMPEANQYRDAAGFWGGFWDFLWLKPRTIHDVALRMTYSQERLRTFLADVANRYDRPGSSPSANVDTLGFAPGEPGHILDVEATVSLVDSALRSPTNRVVALPIDEQLAVRPSFDTLADLTRQNLQLFEFEGVFSMYLMDLSTGRELNLSLAAGQEVPADVAFSGMSTIKIPVMVSFFGHNAGEVSDDERLLLQRSIDESANTATDLLIKIVGRGDGFEGTRIVTNDMQRLGLADTYLSGLLDELGAVLFPLSTPANSRIDINTLPDPYNQTTAEDMGYLTVMIYQCSQGGGALLAAFPGQYTPEECRMMIDLLTQNKVGPIFISGGSSPDGVVAHKHGWDRLPLNNVADAALVFTPGGNYALTIFLHRSEPMTFDDANRIMISAARAIYNYFNWERP